MEHETTSFGDTSEKRRSAVAARAVTMLKLRGRRRRRLRDYFLRVAIVLAIVAVAAYLLADFNVTPPEVDDSVAALSQTYLCAKCKQAFEISVAQAAGQRRKHGDVLCTRCGAAGAEKLDVRVQIGMPSESGASETGSEDSTHPQTSRPNDKSSHAVPVLNRQKRLAD